MSDKTVAKAARAYVHALDEPTVREGWDSPDDYYHTGPTSDELLDTLRARVSEEMRAPVDVDAGTPFEPDQTEWTATDEAEQEARLRPIELPF